MKDHDSSLPQDAVVAFAGDCPEGWRDFDQAAGRMLVGAGQGKDLPERKQGQIGGGSENAELILSIPLFEDFSTDPSIINPSPESSNQSISVPGPALPPFLVVRYCESPRNQTN